MRSGILTLGGEVLDIVAVVEEGTIDSEYFRG